MAEGGGAPADGVRASRISLPPPREEQDGTPVAKIKRDRRAIPPPPDPLDANLNLRKPARMVSVDPASLSLRVIARLRCRNEENCLRSQNRTAGDARHCWEG
jgi:hypothetical protein